MNKLDMLKNYKFQINDRVYSKDMGANGTVIALSQNVVFNEDTNEHEIANWYSIEFDDSTEGEIYSIYEKDLKLIPRELKYPAIYKHFKGHHYGIIGISFPVSIECKNDCSMLEVARHTENNELIGIYCDNIGYLHDKKKCEDKLVLYRPLYLLSDTDVLYVRPLDMFLSEVNREKYPNVEQRFRFDEVK